jgi:L-iditol 2-dehydrogenase
MTEGGILADTNNAAVLYGPRDIRIENRPIPKLSPDEVLIRSTDVSICATEVKYWYHGIPDVPTGTKIIQGHELGGIIEGTGETARGKIAIGTKVTIDPSLWCGVCDMCMSGMSNLCRKLQFMSLPPVDGGFQQFYNIPLKNVHPVPKNMPEDWASMVEPVCVMLNAIADAEKIIGSTSGKNVAIVGAGSLGLILLQALSLHSKPNLVCVLDPVDYRLKIAKKLGADLIINPKTDNPLEKVMDVTNGIGADIVFELAGEPDAYQLSSNLAKPNGTLVIVGIPVDQEYIPIKCITARRSGLTLKFVRRFNPKDFPKAINLIASGNIKIDSLITHSFPLDEINTAFEMLHNYSDEAIKIVIHPH